MFYNNRWIFFDVTCDAYLKKKILVFFPFQHLTKSRNGSWHMCFNVWFRASSMNIFERKTHSFDQMFEAFVCASLHWSNTLLDWLTKKIHKYIIHMKPWIMYTKFTNEKKREKNCNVFLWPTKYINTLVLAPCLFFICTTFYFEYMNIFFSHVGDFVFQLSLDQHAQCIPYFMCNFHPPPVSTYKGNQAKKMQTKMWQLNDAKGSKWKKVTNVEYTCGTKEETFKRNMVKSMLITTRVQKKRN